MMIFFKYLTRKFKCKICVNCDFVVVLLLFSLSWKILHGFVPKHVSALVLLWSSPLVLFRMNAWIPTSAASSFRKIKAAESSAPAVADGFHRAHLVFVIFTRRFLTRRLMSRWFDCFRKYIWKRFSSLSFLVICNQTDWRCGDGDFADKWPQGRQDIVCNGSKNRQNN